MTATVQEVHDNLTVFTKLNIERKVNQLLKMHNNDITILKHLSDEDFQPLLSYLRSVNIPSSDKRLNKPKVDFRVAKRKWGLTDNEHFDSYDTYYRNYINDILREIRDKKSKNKVGYCHHFYHVKELLRFEPDINVELDKGIFKVWLDR